MSRLKIKEIDGFLGLLCDFRQKYGNYLDSIGGIEAYVKITEGLQKKDIKYISLFFIPIKTVKSIIIRAIKGFDFSKDYKKGLYDLLKF